AKVVNVDVDTDSDGARVISRAGVILLLSLFFIQLNPYILIQRPLRHNGRVCHDLGHLLRIEPETARLARWMLNADFARGILDKLVSVRFDNDVAVVVHGVTPLVWCVWLPPTPPGCSRGVSARSRRASSGRGPMSLSFFSLQGPVEQRGDFPRHDGPRGGGHALGG